MKILEMPVPIDESGQNGFAFDIDNRGAFGNSDITAQPTARIRPAWITMIESSSGGRPVPSINVPPLTTIAFSAIFSSEFTSIIYLLSSPLRNQ